MENGVNPETGEMADPTACGEPMAALVAKIVLACGSMKAVEKTGENAFQKYKYIRLEDVIGEVRRALLVQGVLFYRSNLVTAQYEMREGSDKRIGTFVRLDIEYTLTDGRARLILPATAEARGVDDKSLQKAQSSALKYALFQNFLLQHEEDIDEGDGQVERGNRPQAQPPRRATVTEHRTSVGTQPAVQPQRAATAAPVSEPCAHAYVYSGVANEAPRCKYCGIPKPDWKPQGAARSAPASQPASASTAKASTPPTRPQAAKTGLIGAEGASLIEKWIEQRHAERPERGKQSTAAILAWAEKDEGAGQKKRSIESLAEIQAEQFLKLAATWGMVEQEDGSWAQRK